ITPNGASASLTALRIAAGAPVAPASPAPLKPPAMPGAGGSRGGVSGGGADAPTAVDGDVAQHAALARLDVDVDDREVRAVGEGPRRGIGVVHGRLEARLGAAHLGRPGTNRAGGGGKG